MVLSVIEYVDVIYSGISSSNLNKVDKLLYRGFRISLGNDIIYNTNESRNECKSFSLT